MSKITSREVAYDISRIPAVRQALYKMDESECMNGRGPMWDDLLAIAANVMDDDIREQLHSQIGERSACDFLCIYAARHERKYGMQFDF